MASKKTRTLNELTLLNSQNTIVQNPVISSKLSEVYVWGGGIRLPKQIEFFKNENAPLQVALGHSHYAVLTVEKELFTWNIASKGGSNSLNAKLGHGKKFGNTRTPKRVEALNGISIEKVACGEEITCCLSEDGSLYIFGTNLYGLLDICRDDLEPDLEDELDSDGNVFSPVKIQFFEQRNLKVKSFACGDSHVIVLTETNQIFTWGCGEFGRLGHGDEDDRREPTELKFPLKYKFKNVYAGSDASFVLTKEGRVLAFGNNEFNKLCLNENPIGFKNANNQKCVQDNSHTISQQLIPKLVIQLSSYNISKICTGQNHTAVIDYFGRLFTFGSNKHGQLGVGDSKRRSGVNLVSGTLAGHCVTKATCGDTFTICSTSENHIFSWGNRKDGRLGLDSIFDDNSTNNSSICLPKPIFGSLHLVSDMSAKHWNSIIIAEKELNAKPVRSVSYADYMRKASFSNQSPSSGIGSEINAEQLNQVESVYQNYLEQNSASRDEVNRNQESTFQKRVFNNQMNDSTGMPEWLKKDLEDADFIPIEALDKKESVKAESIPEEQNSNPINSLEVALAIIRDLREEILKLKEENEQLSQKLLKMDEKKL